MQTNYNYILEELRNKWIKKRALTIEHRDDIINEGKKVPAAALDLVIDQSQDIINDLSESLQTIKSLDQYHKHTENLIKNLTK